MKRKALQVTLEVREPSVVELTVGDKVQLDRLSASPQGYVAERHGKLLDAGLATLALDPGVYYFKTLSHANLRVIRGGVDAIARDSDPKDPWPRPLSAPQRGDEVIGETPTLTVA